MESIPLPHTRTVKEVLDYYKVSEDEGLSQDRVLEQRKKFGYNGEFFQQYRLAS